MLRNKYIHRLLVVVVLAMLSVATAQAQSGRRVNKPTALPPVPTPTPETIAPVSKEKPKPALTVIVGLEAPAYYGNAAIVNESAALLALVDRLDDHPGVEVAHVAWTMTRIDAVRRAKSEKEAYVIFIEVNLDRVMEELRLSYWVYSPQTAEVKTFGQTYPKMYRNRVILNPRPTVNGDRQVEEASREIAERILKAFQLHKSPGRPVV